MIITNQSNITKLLAVTAVLAALVVFLSGTDKFSTDQDVQVKAAVPVSGFSLLDHNDKLINSEMFIGKWTFVFFGFTNCPDVCPATLSQLVQLNKLINSDSIMAGKFQTLFVSVDPDRDGTQHIKEFVKYFDPGFIGATGTMENITRFEQQFGAFHIIGDKSKEDYNVGHTSSVFLVNPDGVVTSKISPPMDVAIVAQQLQALVQGFTGS